jgi:hypothetical protein
MGLHWRRQQVQERDELSAKDAFAIAAQHTYSYWEGRNSHRVQVVNFQILFMALLATAYGGILASNKNGQLLVALGFIGCVGSLANLVQDLQFRKYLDVSSQALADLQDRLAETLDMDSLRLISQLEGRRGVRFRVILTFFYGFCATIGLAAAAYGSLRL